MIENADWTLYADPGMKLLCELPDKIISIKCEENKIIAETEGGWYEILQDGSFVGIRK